MDTNHSLNSTQADSADLRAQDTARALGLNKEQTDDLINLYKTRGMVTETLKDHGYTLERIEAGTGHGYFQDESGISQVVLNNGLRIEHSNGQRVDGGMTVFVRDRVQPHWSEGVVVFKLDLTPGIVLPAPSADFIDNVVKVALENPGVRDSFVSLMEIFRADLYSERFQHEQAHLIDLLSDTPWGRVMLTGQAASERESHIAHVHGINLANTPVEVSQSIDKRLKDRVLPKVPDSSEILAARLLSEMNAFVHNTKGMPLVAQAAVKAQQGINQQLLSGHAGVEKEFRQWRDSLVANSSGYENLTRYPEIPGIAARWVLEHGGLS